MSPVPAENGLIRCLRRRSSPRVPESVKNQPHDDNMLQAPSNNKPHRPATQQSNNEPWERNNTTCDEHPTWCFLRAQNTAKHIVLNVPYMYIEICVGWVSNKSLARFASATSSDSRCLIRCSYLSSMFDVFCTCCSACSLSISTCPFLSVSLRLGVCFWVQFCVAAKSSLFSCLSKRHTFVPFSNYLCSFLGLSFCISAFCVLSVRSFFYHSASRYSVYSLRIMCAVSV